MKFLCGSCRTKYQISDEKVRGKILTIRCKKCGAKVIVKESLARSGGIAVAPVADEQHAEKAEVEVTERPLVERVAAASTLASAFDVAMGASADDMPTSIGPTPQNEEDAGIEWYTAMDGNQTGPYAYAELIRQVRARELQGRHYVWHDGFDGWKRVRDCDDLAAFLPADQRKKPPPVPPPDRDSGPAQSSAGAEVVDFASKRAERERRAQGGPGAEPAIALAPDQEVNSGPDDSIAAGAETVRSTAALEEDLDNVLNQALGIQGEGKTSQASAGGGGSGLGSAGTADAAAHDAFSLGAREELNADKLFESVPRANPADLVNRESTKFFVAAAGVDAKKKKNKMGFAIGGGAAAAVALFIVAWAAGYIQINIPGIGNPFASNRQAENELPMADELTPEQIEEIRRGLATRREIEERRRARREGTGGGTARSKRAQAEPSGYVTDGADEREEGGRRGDEVASVGIDGQLGAGAGPVGGLPDAVLPGADLSGIEPVTSGRLDQNVIRQVVNERKSSVSICYQRELKGNSNLRGKMEFLVTVEASGIVSQAGVQSPAFKGTALASCIADKIKGWRFPPFEGAAQQIVVPFVLE